MTLTTFIISLLWILTLIIAFSLFLQIIMLKERILVLKENQKFLDQQISDLGKQLFEANVFKSLHPKIFKSK
jgi:uncharacterized membrane protein